MAPMSTALPDTGPPVGDNSSAQEMEEEPQSTETATTLTVSAAANQSSGGQAATADGSHVTDPIVVKFGPSDVWSAGLVLFVMLTGFPPFSCTDPNTCRRYAAVLYDDFPTFWKLVNEQLQSQCKCDDQSRPISTTAKSFLEALLQPNPDSRLKLSDVLNCEWMKGPVANQQLFENEMGRRYRRLTERRAWSIKQARALRAADSRRKSTNLQQRHCYSSKLLNASPRAHVGHSSMTGVSPISRVDIHVTRKDGKVVDKDGNAIVGLDEDIPAIADGPVLNTISAVCLPLSTPNTIITCLPRRALPLDIERRRSQEFDVKSSGTSQSRREVIVKRLFVSPDQLAAESGKSRVSPDGFFLVNDVNECMTCESMENNGKNVQSEVHPSD